MQLPGLDWSGISFTGHQSQSYLHEFAADALGCAAAGWLPKDRQFGVCQD